MLESSSIAADPEPKEGLRIKSGVTFVLFDSDCLMCSKWVEFVVRSDAHRRCLFAGLNSEAGIFLLEASGKDFRGIDSIAVLEDSLLLWKSRAILQILRRLGFPLRVMCVFGFFPSKLLDRLYDWVACRRKRWFTNAACSLSYRKEVGDRIITRVAEAKPHLHEG